MFETLYRGFQSAKEKGVQGLPELVVFEKQEDWSAPDVSSACPIGTNLS